MQLTDVDIDNIFASQTVAKAKFQLKFYNYKSCWFQQQNSYFWNQEPPIGPVNPNIAVLQQSAIPAVPAVNGVRLGQPSEIGQITTLEPPSKRRRTEAEQIQPNVVSTSPPPSCGMTDSSIVQPANRIRELDARTQDDAEDSDDEELIADPTSVEQFYKYRDFYNPVQKNEPLFKFLDNESNFLGNTILYHFYKTQEVQKKLLCRLIIEHEMAITRKTSNPFSIQRKQFKAIARSIAKIFKGEEEDCYYESSYVIAAVDKDPQKRKRVNARGSLVREYETYRTRVKQINLLTTRQNSSKSSTNPNSLARKELHGVDLSILNVADLLLENQSHAVQTWKDVFAYRREIAFALKSATEIINEFRILRTFVAPELIRYDFSQLFGPEISNTMINSWPTFALQIINLVSKEIGVMVTLHSAYQENEIPEKGFELINFSNQKDNLMQNQIIYNEGHRDALALSLLPTLIQHTPPPHKDTKNWKISAKEKVDSFFENIEKHEALENLVKKKIDVYKGYKLKSQPYLVLCGPFHHVSCYHVVIDDIIYNCKNVIDALDLCYQLFFVLNLNYSHPCPHVWSFVQKYFYKMKNRKIVQSQKISTVISKLNKTIV